MSLELVELGLTLNGHALVAPFNLNVAAGEIVTVMGPSGCGKSSLLSAIAGTLQPPLGVQGDVRLNGASLVGIAPERRQVGRLFQDDLLFPHMTVGENLLFGMARGERQARQSKMRDGLRNIGLEGFEARAPHTLSGGQRQRVALMRSLLAQPKAMLLDEPFSKLDSALRADIRSSTFDLLKRSGTPTVLVTHDVDDAPEGGRIFEIAD